MTLIAIYYTQIVWGKHPRMRYRNVLSIMGDSD